MAANKKLLILPGDGIGPEVMRQVRRTIDWLGKRRAVAFEVSEALVGGAAIDKEGLPVTDATMAKGAWRPMPCCWAPSAARNGTTCPSPRSRSAACFACARIWSCSPICAPPSSSTRWPKPRR